MTTASTPGRPTGRRAGDSGTRDAILDAAVALFADRGYEGASLRAIASEAGVDPALIRHFFGDKEALFATVVADRTAIPERLGAAVGDDLTSAGRAVTDAYLRLWEQPDTAPVLLTLVRSATTSPRAAEMLREVLMSQARQRTAGDPAAARRLALAGAHLFGVAVSRHVVRLPILAEPDLDTLVDEIAPTIQRYLSGEHR